MSDSKKIISWVPGTDSIAEDALIRKHRVRAIVVMCMIISLFGVLDAYLLLQPNQLKQNVRYALRQVIQTDFDIGNVYFRPFEGLLITDLNVYDKEKKLVMEAPRTQVTFSYWPFGIESITAKRPTFVLDRPINGPWNFNDVIAKGDGSMPSGQTLSNFVVEGAAIVLHDEHLFGPGHNDRIEDITVSYAGGASEGAINLQGHLKDRHLGRVEIYFLANPRKNTTTLGFKNVDFFIPKGLRKRLPHDGKAIWDLVEPSGRVRADVTIFQTGSQPATLKGNVDLVDVGARFKVFPYPITDISGDITFTEKVVELKNIKTTMHKNTVKSNAVITLAGEESTLDLYVSVPDVPVDERIFAALPKEVAETVGRLGLKGRGRCDIYSKGFPYKKNGVNFKIVGGRYWNGTALPPELPAPVTNLIADWSVLNETFTLHTLSGQTLGSTINGRGFVGPKEADLTVNLSGISEVEGALKAAHTARTDKNLPANLRRNAENLHRFITDIGPKGTFEIEIALKDDPSVPNKGPNAGPNEGTTVTIIPRKAQVTPTAFPYPLDVREGHVVIREKSGVTMEDLTFSPPRGVGEIRMNGSFTGFEENDLVNILVDFKDLPLDSKFRNGLKPEYRTIWNDHAPEGGDLGDLDGSLTLSKDRGETNLTPSGLVQLRKGTFQRQDRPIHIEELEGTLSIHGRRAVIEKLTGRIAKNKAPLSLSGLVEFPPKGAPGFNFVLQAPDLPIDHNLVDALGEDTNSIERTSFVAFGAKGTADLTIRFHRPPGALVVPEPTVEISAQLKGVNISHDVFRYPIRDIKGPFTMSISPKGEIRTNFDGLKGHAGAGEIKFGGSLEGPKHAPLFTLKVEFDDLLLDRHFRKALPETWRRDWREMRPDGHLAGVLNMLVDLEEDHLYWNGRFRVWDGKGDMGVKLDKVSGRIVVVGDSPTLDPPSLKSLIVFDKMKWKDQPITDTRARITMKDSRVDIDNIRANAYGGRLSGEFYKFLRRPQLFYGQVALHNGRPEKLVENVFPQEGGKTGGQLNASITFLGDAENPKSLQGEGRMDITNAQLVKIPLILRLPGFLNIFEDKDKGQNFALKYRLEGKEIPLEEVAFRAGGVGISLSDPFNNAKACTNGNLDFWLSTKVFDSTITDPIHAVITDQLYAIHVTGTVDEPIISSEIFPGLGTIWDWLKGLVAGTDADPCGE